MEQGRKRILIGVSIGHAVHDTWYGVAPIFLAVISAQVRLSNADIGLVLLLYQAVSAASQPFFGRLSERIGGRPMAVGSILWTTAMFTMALFAQSKLMLMIPIGLAGFGSGAWHPQAAANATIAGGKRYAATASSVFFFGGTLGTAVIGSALGGYLLENYGIRSLLVISSLTAILAITVVRQLVPLRLEVTQESTPHEVAATTANRAGKAFWGLLAVLLVGTALRSFSSNSIITYVPKFLEDSGRSAASYGLVMSLYSTGMAVGGVLGAYLADRLGMQRVLAISLVLSALALRLFLGASGVWAFVAITLTGLIIGPSHTLFLVAAQRQFAQSMAMASGVFLGFTFVSGSVGAWLLGLLADSVGLELVLNLLPLALIIGAACALIGVPRHLARPEKEPDVAAASPGA